MAARNPTSAPIPPLKAPDPKEIAESMRETKKHERILAARQPRSSPNPGSNR